MTTLVLFLIIFFAAGLTLLAANLVNKQAFYNQYWLSAARVAMSLAVPRRDASPVLPERRSPSEVSHVTVGSD